VLFGTRWSVDAPTPGLAHVAFITQILLPKRDNLGRRYLAEAYRAFHARMIRRYGGWTRKGQAEGAWLSPAGQVYIDEHRVDEIGHPRRDLRFWQTEKERLKSEFGQVEIWIVQYEGRRL
jgi:hypothetical protein